MGLEREKSSRTKRERGDEERTKREREIVVIWVVDTSNNAGGVS